MTYKIIAEHEHGRKMVHELPTYDKTAICLHFVYWDLKRRPLWFTNINYDHVNNKIDYFSVKRGKMMRMYIVN